MNASPSLLRKSLLGAYRKKRKRASFFVNGRVLDNYIHIYYEK